MVETTEFKGTSTEPCCNKTHNWIAEHQKRINVKFRPGIDIKYSSRIDSLDEYRKNNTKPKEHVEHQADYYIQKSNECLTMCYDFELTNGKFKGSEENWPEAIGTDGLPKPDLLISKCGVPIIDKGNKSYTKTEQDPFDEHETLYRKYTDPGPRSGWVSFSEVFGKDGLPNPDPVISKDGLATIRKEEFSQEKNQQNYLKQYSSGSKAIRKETDLEKITREKIESLKQEVRNLSKKVEELEEFLIDKSTPTSSTTSSAFSVLPC